VAIVKIKNAISGTPKVVEEAPKPVVKEEAVTTGVPSIESPAFAKFVETVAFEKLLDSDEQLNKLFA
jgi:hypothetical protein